MRCRESTEKPRVDVKGFGQGIRAVTEDINPSCNTSGKSGRKASIAYISCQTLGDMTCCTTDERRYPTQDRSPEHILNQSACLFGENRAGQA